jgi:Ca-activated chloride channel family protein
MEDYLRFDAHSDAAGMDLEIVNSYGKKEMNVDVLINLSSSGKNAERKPLNICFALDRSASMGENDRMEKLKTALKETLSLLTSDDYFSVVVYDDIAQVVLPSRCYDKSQDSIFREIIDRITIGGGTNMLAGMLKGYGEIYKNSNRMYRNRLILMSDGVSTTGEKDPDKILKHTIDYHGKGIETSVIGIGNNINFELLHLVSVEGRGTSHFVGDCDDACIDISYVLQEEFHNMNANMENIQLEISYPKSFRLSDVYGASKILTDDKLVVLSSNLSRQNQVILLKFKVKKQNRKDMITVNLNFRENGKEKHIVKQALYVNNIAPSEMMLQSHKIVEAVNCIKKRIVNRQYRIDCLDRFVSEPNVPDNIVLLRQLVK